MMLKKTILCSLCVWIIALQSCIPSKQMMEDIHGHYYKYTFALKESKAHKKETRFTNADFSIQFIAQYSRISFQLINLTNQDLIIDWNHVSFVVHNDSCGVIHNGLSYEQKDNIKPPFTLKANQRLQDFIIPVNFIHLKNNQWVVDNIYPDQDDDLSLKTDWIMGLIGEHLFTIYIPMTIHGLRQVFPFSFYPIEMQRSAKPVKPNGL